MSTEKIQLSNVLIIVDDLAIPFGALRLKTKGSDAGHNGLKNIQEILGTQNYARLRFGIGSDFPKGAQVQYVLDKFSPEEQQTKLERIDIAIDIIKTFCLAGVNIAMNTYNNK